MNRFAAPLFLFSFFTATGCASAPDDGGLRSR